MALQYKSPTILLVETLILALALKTFSNITFITISPDKNNPI